MFPLKNNKPKKDTVLFMSSGEPFKGKKIREEDAKGADADSQWELCYTEAGDQVEPLFYLYIISYVINTRISHAINTCLQSCHCEFKSSIDSSVHFV
jgi:hypothetical protein